MQRLRILLTLAALCLPCLGAAGTVDAILASPRTEPRHFVDTALALSDLREAAAAEGVVTELIALQLDDAQRIKLVDTVGAGKLARLAREFPSAMAFVEGCLIAANQSNTAPSKLSELVNQLGSDNRDQVASAIRSISRTGLAGVDHCLNAIASAGDKTLQDRLREALVALDPISLPALYAGLSDENTAVRTQSAYALGRLAKIDRLRSSLATALVAARAVSSPAGEPDSQAAQWAYTQLSGEPFSAPAAARIIEYATEQLLAGELPLTPQNDGLVLWRSDRSSTWEPHPPRQVAVWLASRLAQASAELQAGNPEAQRRAALLTAESGDTESGLNSLSPQDVTAALATSLKQQLPSAAEACCARLAELGDMSVLITKTGKPSPLADALEAPLPSVRFAALQAIVAIGPDSPFPGSSRVGKTLAYFAESSGLPQAVVAYPNLAKASNVAGLLIAEGYAASPVNNGAVALQIASSADTRFVLLDLATIRPGVRDTLFRLRRTADSASLPVALLASEGRLEEARALASEHGGEAAAVIASPRPHTPETVAALAQQLERLAPASTAEERRIRADWARQTLAQLSEEGPSFYRLSRQAPR